MADLVSLPVDFISIEAVSQAPAAPAATTPAAAQQASRKLRQDATAAAAAAPAEQPIVVSTRIATPEPEATAGALQAALVTGELGDMLASMKLTLTASKLEVCRGGCFPHWCPLLRHGLSKYNRMHVGRLGDTGRRARQSVCKGLQNIHRH